MRATTRRWALLGVSVLLAACGAEKGAGQGQDAARVAWRAGRYDEALSAYAALAGQPNASASVHRERARLLMDLSRYDEAEQVLTAASNGAMAVQLAGVLGEVLMARGKNDQAEAALQRAISGNAPDRNVARYNLAVLQWQKGQREQAFPVFDSYIDLYNDQRDRLGSEDLIAVGDAVRYVAVTNPDLFEDALHAYDRAAAASEPGDPVPTIRAGELFLDKYQASDAHESFDQVLQQNAQNPRALVGKAKTLSFDGNDTEAMEAVNKALETAPDYPDAHILLARLYLKLEEWEQAEAEVEKALAVNPASLEGLSVLAAVHYLTGDMAGYNTTRERALALNPRYPDLYNTVATLAIDQRKYHAAVELARQAVQLDSLSWWGWGTLGINQLRIGQIEEGTANVDKAFKGDPHNIWLFNTLKLTDTFSRYKTVSSPHFQFFMDGREADLLEPYIVQIAEEAYAALVRRYKAEPPLPVRVEVFPSHGDFSVRTLGLTGLGALGVSFGSVLVMDSPSARPPGEFNWASTLWHELSHAFHLAITDHKVPRWFSEGLAVHEQRLARPYWGFRADPGFLQAYEAGRFNPVSQLNHGFVRPTYPEQVVHSYLQASLVFDMIEEQQGVEPILAMMRGYRDGKSTEQLVSEVLRTTPEALDESFDRWFRQKYEVPLQAVDPRNEPPPFNIPVEDARRLVAQRPNDFVAQLTLGRRLFEEGQLDAAEGPLREALRLFPDYAGAESPLSYLSQIAEKRGQKKEAADDLKALSEKDESAYELLTGEAKLRRELGDRAAETAALARAMQVFPYEVEYHQRLAELYAEANDPAGAVRERKAILALDPTDKAGAHFGLAQALVLAGDRAGARTQLLRALEIAPAYPGHRRSSCSSGGREPPGRRARPGTFFQLPNPPALAPSGPTQHVAGCP
jgi:tetratricopeptide (TPR) repeat protein